MTDVKAYAAKLLDELRALDKQTNHAYFNMGRMLNSLHKDKLWDVLGYPSFSAMVDEELTYVPSTAKNYIDYYSAIRRLKFNEQETKDLLATFSYSELRCVLPTFKDKPGKRAIRNRINDVGKVAFSVQLTREELAFFHEIMISFGAELTESGVLRRSHEAFVNIMQEFQLEEAA